MSLMMQTIGVAMHARVSSDNRADYGLILDAQKSKLDRCFW